MDRVYRGVNGLGRLALRALDVRVHPHGLENLPASGPVVLAANHVSFLDFVMIERAAVERGRYVRFLTRYDAWKPGPLAWVLDRMGHVPVDRGVPAAAYLRARGLLRAGEAVGVFPEAGISWSYTVRSLMRGAVALARETGAPLVPVAVWGSQRIYSVGIPESTFDLTRGRRVDVALGAPRTIPPGADLVEETRALGHTLTGMLEELQSRPEHRPRPGEHAIWYPAHLGGQAPTRAEAAPYEELPGSAIRPTWGPGSGAA
ncbi:1-acyl-sn-glycerol-3-phosphate acyltransferase [Nocardioides marmoriginsengisoli]|uniref:1-acyl-sn-glycerol-3-phosphate acyltransferase n=1 Tax=Nocardioides marmoriginsengisoli TaxID=661483 RepID=A0A3N0CCV7_9ACTN|nr:lysophospholipid acyltransferase family protein [Nocardioides marmoriginsengisoli]RNL61139.1 1-acyl-sn-glycerol-3-phosphate acyltransferase [Nocardioides marmoriginsengisoli]